jgi:hypothetical protein
MLMPGIGAVREEARHGLEEPWGRGRSSTRRGSGSTWPTWNCPAADGQVRSAVTAAALMLLRDRYVS